MQKICGMDVGSAARPPCAGRLAAGRSAPRRGDEIWGRQGGLHSVKVPDRGKARGDQCRMDWTRGSSIVPLLVQATA
jgi:hypothetical protein